MNVCFAVQEMNVPMSQYIEWPITLCAVRLRPVRRAAGTLSPNCFTSLCALSQAPFVLTAAKRTGFLSRVQQLTDASDISPPAAKKSEVFSDKYPHEWIDSMSALRNLQTLWVRKWRLPESERRSAYSTLTNWFHVRYEGEKKNLYLLCTVHGMYCICKDKSNRGLQEDVLVRGCMKRREGSQEN